MEFVLNLKIVNTNIDTNLFGKKELDLSCESQAIICLIDYCQLNSNKDFKCICFYNKNELNVDNNNNLFDQLNNKYNQLNLNFCDLNESLNDPDVLDTNLPSLKRNVGNECTITITGLTSLFRDIIKIANRLRPNLKLDRLLV